MKKKMAMAAGGLLGLCLLPAQAHAGEWRLDQRRCSTITREVHDDRRDDRRDGRYDDRRDDRSDQGRYDDRSDRGRYDSGGRYDRRDSRTQRLTVCSRSAFTYVADRWERDQRRYKKPRLQLIYDRQIGLDYTLAVGRKVYVRG